LQEFHQLHPTHFAIPRTARSVKWRLPPEGFLKVNFDGVVFAANNIAGLGIIICNDSELVMAALSQQIPLPTSVEMVEVGLSMGLSESGLCPTWNRPDGIGFWKISPTVDRWSKRVERIRLQWVASRSVGVWVLRKRGENSEKTRENSEKT